MDSPPALKVGEDLAGRFFNAYGEPIDGGPAVDGYDREIGGPSVNPVRRKQPSEFIATGIAGIDLNNTLVTGQKIPFFADPDQPFNQVMAMVALRAQADKIILGGMGLSNDDYLYYKSVFENAGALDRIIAFVNTTENPPVERLLVPDMALTAAEYFAVEKKEKVLVLLTDMTLFADALSVLSRTEWTRSHQRIVCLVHFIATLPKSMKKQFSSPTVVPSQLLQLLPSRVAILLMLFLITQDILLKDSFSCVATTDIGKVIVDPFRSAFPSQTTCNWQENQRRSSSGYECSCSSLC